MPRRARPTTAPEPDDDDAAADAAAADDDDDDLGILLGLAYQVFVDQLNARLAQRGFDDVRPAFGYVFRALADDPLTSGQLALRLGITPQGAGKLVDQMVAAGYLERRPDALDRRTKWLELTRRGRAALNAARDIHQAIERELSAEVGPARLRTLREVLERLVQTDPSSQLAAPRRLRLP
jgi:DNA-binding MarR family transcriptional regulator